MNRNNYIHDFKYWLICVRCDQLMTNESITERERDARHEWRKSSKCFKFEFTYFNWPRR